MIASQETVADTALALASDVAERYQLASLRPLLDSARSLVERNILSVAVVGRFKAGKSSFLNHFLGRPLLPVGVLPVTAVVTEIGYGAVEKAIVHFLDGRCEDVPTDQISHYVSESENPGNTRKVVTLRVELPALARMRGLRFVDVPGLESALAHNTETALRWLPNTGLALVAVSVDQPLSRHDLTLLEKVYEFTPHVSLLLTKVDLLSDSDLSAVITFIRDRLKQNFVSPPAIFPYSVRPGREALKTRIEEALICETLAGLEEKHRAALSRKLETVVRECREYLTLALKGAETVDCERDSIKQQVVCEREALDELKSELHLVVRQAVGVSREAVAKRMTTHQAELEGALCLELKEKFPDWCWSLRLALESFQGWLGDSLREKLLAISATERSELQRPVEKLGKQVVRSLQNFRERLSDRTERAFGTPLRTTEPDIAIEEPSSPDIHIGKVFDRNWELLSLLVPMSLVSAVVRRHFMRKLPFMIEKNLSRLATQWDDNIRAAMTETLNEAEGRLEELVETVERLITTSNDEAPKIRADLQRINASLAQLLDGSLIHDSL
jgi:GTP-binding protein EngB required for normal cell division